jgi:MFS family permease
MLFFLAPALGPTIGGLITATAGWQPIFLVNVPLIAAGLLGVRRLPPDPARTHERARLDLTGLVLLAAGATLTTLGAAQVTGSGWSAPRAWGGVLLGLALLLGYAAHERRTRVPAVSLRLLADAGSRTAVGVSVLASVVLFSTLFLIPVFLLQTQGRSPVAAGLVLLPQGLAMGVCSGVGDKLVRTWGLRATVTTGMAVLGLSTGLMLLTDARTAPWLFAILLTGRGAALGLTLQPLVTGMLSQTASRAAAGGAVGGVTDVSTLFNVVQRVGASLGVAGIAAFYESRSGGQGFHDTVWLLVAAAAAGAVLASRLARGPGTGTEGATSTEASAEASR